MNSSQRPGRKLILPLAGSLVVMVIMVAGFICFDKFFSGHPIHVNNIKIDTKAALKLNIVKQISKKNGITQWKLKAATATLLKNENRAVLTDVDVVFFTKDNKKVHLKCKKGFLDTITHDMSFSDNVVIRYDGAVMKTDKLHYTKKEHIIYTDSHIRVEKKNSRLEADSMITRLNNDTLVLKGHVKGFFSDRFSIQ
jgi:lipopolysaccharide export system protein LptC